MEYWMGDPITPSFHHSNIPCDVEGILAVETMTAGREFARRFNNILCEMQLQNGIHRRIEKLVGEFGEEHAGLRAVFVSREVDDSYFMDGYCPPEAVTRPKLHGLAAEGQALYEFVAFHQGFRREVVDLRTIVHIQETWLEPSPETPFVLRVNLYHNFPAATVLLATSGEMQDLAQDFVARLKYMRGW